MTKKTGGPAFPNTASTIPKEGDYWNYQGMTLRDYFAANAMQSIVSVLHQGIRPADIKTMCDDSYTIADAMLKAREQ